MIKGRLYLHRAVIHQNTVQLAEGLASTIRLKEGHGGNTTADTVGAV